jgi:AraC-binding-like domain
MTDPTMDLLDVGEWAPAKTFDDFALGCCRQPHLHLLTDTDRFSLIRQAGCMGPLALSEFLVGADVSMGGEQCSTYRVIVVQSGHMESVHRGLAVSAGPGTAVVYPPDGAGAARWAAGSNIISFKIDRCAVEDVLSDALGRQVTSGFEFTPFMPMTAAATHGWMSMLLLFREQLFRQGSVLRQPMVGLPFADSLVRGFCWPLTIRTVMLCYGRNSWQPRAQCVRRLRSWKGRRSCR